MQRAERKEDAVSTDRDFVSPLLLRPLRSYEQVMREHADRTRGRNQPDTLNGTTARSPALNRTDDVDPSR